MRCAVFGCKSDTRTKNGEKFQLFRFPKNEKMQGIWKNFCKRDDNFNLNTARICSKHFNAHDLISNVQNELFKYSKKHHPLKPDVMPKLYFPDKQVESHANESNRNRLTQKVDNIVNNDILETR